MIFAKRRGALIGIAIAFLIAVAVAVIVHHPHSAPNSPEGLLLKADQMAWGNNWPGAAPYYAQAEVLFKNRHDSRHALYARVSQIPVRTQNTEQLTLLHEVDTYLRLPEAADPEIRLRILTIRGIVENNYDSLLASKTWAEVEKLAVQQHKFYLAARAHGEEGIGAFLAGNVSEARSHVLQAYFVAKYLHDPAALVRYASLYGAGRVQLGLYESGLEALDEAIRVAKNNPDIAFPMIAYNYKISALAGLGRYQEGLAIAQEGLAHLRQLGDVKGYLYGILTSRGQLYMNQKNWPAAIDDFGTAVSCAKQIGFWIGLMEGDSFLAQAYEGAGQLPKALAAIDEALEANKRIPDETYFLPGNLAIKARIQSELGQIADASTSYEEGQAIAITMLRTARTRDIERTVLVQLSDLYAGNFALLCKVQRYPQAFHVIETERGRLEAESLQEPRRPESLHLPAIAEQQVMHQVMQQQFRVVDGCFRGTRREGRVQPFARCMAQHPVIASTGAGVRERFRQLGSSLGRRRPCRRLTPPQRKGRNLRFPGYLKNTQRCACGLCSKPCYSLRPSRSRCGNWHKRCANPRSTSSGSSTIWPPATKNRSTAFLSAPCAAATRWPPNPSTTRT